MWLVCVWGLPALGAPPRTRLLESAGEVETCPGPKLLCTFCHLQVRFPRRQLWVRCPPVEALSRTQQAPGPTATPSPPSPPPPAPQVRGMAAAAVAALLEGPQQRAFMALADGRGVAVGPLMAPAGAGEGPLGHPLHPPKKKAFPVHFRNRRVPIITSRRG